MLGHHHAGSRAKNGGGCGNIKCAQPVAAGADHIQNLSRSRTRVQRQSNGFIVQCADKRGNFGGRLTFQREGAQEFRLKSDGNRFGGQQFDGHADFFFVQRLPCNQLFDERFKHTLILA
jgi:hypothetical protein